MCGIVGIAPLAQGRPPSSEQLARMCGSIAHRGPDDQGWQTDSQAAFGQTRGEHE